MLVREAITRYVQTVAINHRGASQERYRARVISRSALGGLDLTAVTGADVLAYRNGWLAEGRAAATVRLELALLSSAFRTAAEEWGYEELVNPVSRVRKPSARNARNRRVTDGELVALIRAATGGGMRVMAVLVVIALETAARTGELAELQWSDVNLARRILEIRQAKNGHPRTVPLTRRAVSVLAKYRADQGGEGSLFGMTSRAIGQRWQKLRRLAGVEGLRFHDLRHSGISALAERGLSAIELQAISGHRTLASCHGTAMFAQTHCLLV